MSLCARYWKKAERQNGQNIAEGAFLGRYIQWFSPKCRDLPFLRPKWKHQHFIDRSVQFSHRLGCWTQWESQRCQHPVTTQTNLKLLITLWPTADADSVVWDEHADWPEWVTVTFWFRHASSHSSVVELLLASGKSRVQLPAGNLFTVLI